MLETCWPLPPHRTLRAVEVIRRARGRGHDCGYPHDLGCETQLYLGIAISIEYPEMTMTSIAKSCDVSVVDAVFFAVLCDIAKSSDWIRTSILAAACDAVAGRPVIAHAVSSNLGRARNAA
jgi:hypothetical protein